MRMRKKKYLDERLAECKENLFEYLTEERNFDDVKDVRYIDFAEYFGNGNPVELEVGCGKGQFVCEMAKRHPELNFIAVEKAANVVVLACEKAKEMGLKNVLFIKTSAEYLPRLIKPHTVTRLYLNFSCPFPKPSYAIHRLTNHRFLKIFDELLVDGAEIHQKTDNMHFFEYSVEQLTSFGYALKNVSFDLHNSGIEDNIVTEYERRFSEQGMPIYRLEAYKYVK